MPTNVLMPKTGADETHGKLVKWFKKEGDRVSRGETVAEIETDKVNMEVESYGEGTLYRILVPEGESEEVGKPIAILLKDGEQPPAESNAKPSVKPESTSAAGSSASPRAAQASRPAVTASAGQMNGVGGRVKASPLARKLAETHDLDLSLIAGRGPGGRVVKSDVEAALAVAAQAPSAPPLAMPLEFPAAQAPAAAEREPVPAGAGEKALNRVQLTAARRMTESKQTAPHFYLTVDVDMAESMKLRAALNEQAAGDVKVSINDMVVKAAAWALRRHPDLNGSYRDGKLVCTTTSMFQWPWHWTTASYRPSFQTWIASRLARSPARQRPWRNAPGPASCFPKTMQTALLRSVTWACSALTLSWRSSIRRRRRSWL
jgi:pyruvate dehydrogenase E2 component (dihydrolipoamide acetyltransferase)